MIKMTIFTPKWLKGKEEATYKTKDFIKASISTHGSVLLILQKQCKTPLKRRRFIPNLIQHFEVKTLQTLWSLK